MPRCLRPFLLASLLLASCVELDDEATFVAEATVPSRGSPSTLDIAEWNLEWFGSPSSGPSNDALQLANARDVIRGADLDLWAVEEIVSKPQFDSLVAQLPGYAGFLSNDARVTSGSSYYTAGEQKLGVIYRTGAISITGSRLILTAQQSSFGGRPPLELDVTATINGTSQTFTVIVLHAKAMSDTGSYNQRLAGSNALKSYLDASHASDRVLVLGDFNDDVDVSITGGRASPYKNFVDDSARYRFPTKVFSEANQRTTVSGSQAIDHHLISNEVVPLFISGSAEIYRVDAYIPSYGSTTTDHYPTLTRYTLGGAPPTPARVVINEILGNELGSDTAGEFIELVNTGSSALDLSGFTLADAAAQRHVFPAGTTLAAGKAIAVFGGASAIPGGITAVAASTGSLGLSNSGDTVTLRDGGGATVDSLAYAAALGGVDGVSMNRNPDTTGTSFVLHTAIASAQSSPGRRANGSSF